MREVEFRGKAKNSNWIYGNLHINSIADKDDKYYINPNFYIENPNYIEIDGKTVGQYTGLKDKNRKEIYEGDIVELNHGACKELGIIKYLEEHGAFKWVDLFDRFMLGLLDLELEVLGNIHDNPELLKEDN